MRNAAVALLVLQCALCLTGCVKRQPYQEKNIVDVLEQMPLVDSPNFSFRSIEAASGGGSGLPKAMLAYWFRAGEITSVDGSSLPADFLDVLAKNIRARLQSQGCTVNEESRGHGDGFLRTKDSRQHNFEDVAVGFDFGKSQGRVEVILVERGFRSDGKNVVGQLIVSVTQAR